MRKLFYIVLFLIVCCLIPVRVLAQQPQQIKVSEINVSHIASLEERVFLIHSILDKGYLCYKNPELPNTIDVYVPADAADELSDFDFFYDHIAYDQLNEFHYLDKNQRGELFVQWRREFDNAVYQTLYDDFTKGFRDGNASCEGAEPFCTGNGLYDFPAGVNSGSPCGTVYNASCDPPYHCSQSTYNHPGQDNCLLTAPNPAFYYFRIDQPGDLDIYMYSNPSEDIDFDCWGPFSDMNSACTQLSCNNIVDCSYSINSTEHCRIYGAQQGQYYVLLITNFSNDPCNIYFQNQSSGSGSATTDCTLLPPMVENGGPYCVGETIQLTANTTVNASYSWTGPNGYTSTEQNPTIPNCTMAMAGLYKCTITYGGQSNFANTQVVIYPNPAANFTATTVCQGQVTYFASTSTPVEAIDSWTWDFGDGGTGSGTTTSHTYSQAGAYQVTLTVTTAGGHCSNQITKTILVIPPLNVDIEVEGGTTICEGDTVTLHAAVDSVEFVFPAVGDILCTDGTIVKPGQFASSGKTAKGIVFYVDNSDLHGWAVSLNYLNNGNSLVWSFVTNVQMGSAYNAWPNAIYDLNGKTNTQNIQTNGAMASYPAAWATDLSQGWYLPSAGQLNVLFGELAVVNASLGVVGGTSITDTASATSVVGNIYIWSSTEKSASSAYALEVQDGQIGPVSKSVTPTGSRQYVVRAIIDF